MKYQRILRSAVALITTPMILMVLPLAAMGSTKTATNSPGCATLDQYGEQQLIGEPAPGLEQFANEMESVIGEFPTELTGTAFCSNFDGIVVYLTTETGVGAASVARMADTHPEFKVEVSLVPASKSTLLEVIQGVMQSPDLKGIVNAASPHIYSGGLTLGVAQAHWPLSDSDRSRIESAATKLSNFKIPLVFHQQDPVQAFTRAVDSAPWYMGGAIWSSTSGCSSGVPLVVYGVSMLLTAGHCTGTDWTNNWVSVGKTYTTAYPGNANIYGDWKLLRNSTYGKYVFSGALSSNSFLPITSATWVGLVNGTAVCTSGQTTAQICRYYVTARDMTAVDTSGVTIGNLLQMRHDNTGGSGSDFNGADHGDSGGPCYYSDGAGGVRAAGILQGGAPIWTGAMRYYCTELAGVRMWNSGAYF